MATQNKLTPLLAIAAVVIIGFVLVRSFSKETLPGATAVALKTVPTPTATPKGEKGADSDSPSDTLRTLTAEVTELKKATQQLSSDNERVKVDNIALRNNENTIVDRVLDKLRSAPKSETASYVPQAARQGTTQAFDPASAAADGMMDNAAVKLKNFPTTIAGFPAGLGFDAKPGESATSATDAATMADAMAGTMPTPAAPSKIVRVIPLGMTETKGANGQTTLESNVASSKEKRNAPVNSWLDTGEPPIDGAPSDARGSHAGPTAAANVKGASRKNTPYFTIPENATLTGATAMTAIVGRVPVDGRVQDPMPFKILIGRSNLAANHQPISPDIAGIVVSGTAIGDMTLNCSEGLIHSLTFIFNDGTVQTVSRRHDGGMPVAGGAQSGIAASAKLGYLSDDYGNPCIGGRFVTNAPSYLTNVIGLKTLTLAAQSAALAQTTTSANALGSTSAVTGNKSTFVLGQAAGGAADEVSSWIMRRLNNSFDAVVTPAGAHVVVHIDQEIRLDKEPEARKLDYAQLNGPGTSSTRARSTRFGLD